ncbi:extracellular solute-binding protein [Paenibacillus sp. MWE-103]|uniref:Extracellular solute-binding protein n=1 Tax=Paenibacillus artemisiicola TaxID=1172618 RepID=A0ABS3W6I6_9BACL|nr:extracellular solute-binding protein [Paenibacillus artemisiicola]MBO7743926.1 extracellular solute-binding protein [Paenibacillus artemisiicola]
MKNKQRGKGKIVLRASAAALSMALVASSLAACSKGSGSDDGKQHVLRVGFVGSNADTESYYRQQFTDGYELTHPNVDIEIVAAINYDDQRFQQPDPNQKQPDVYEKVKEMMNGSNPPDVVIMDSGVLRRLTQDNLVTKLDTLIQDKEFDIDDIVPTVLDGIKDLGDGSIYALTPTFSSSALYYNKKMFADAGIEPPKDNMTWPDVVTLAKRLAKGDGKDRKFGLSFNRYTGDPYWDSQTYSAPLQLKMFDNKAEKMSVDNASWKKVWTDIADLYESKTVPTQEDVNNGAGGGIIKDKAVYDPFQGDLFLSGRVAMMVAGYDYVTQLSAAKDASAKNQEIKSVDWDVVTVPQFTEVPGVGGNIYLNNLMSINAKAQNPDDAWDFIAFNNSKEWAKLKSRSTYEMVSRKSFLKPKDGMSYNIQAFYTLKPVPPQDPAIDKLFQDKPNLYQVQNLAQPLFQEVLQKKKSVDAALKEWQTKGDALLQQIKTNPNGPIDGVGGGVGLGGGPAVDVKPVG